MVPASAPSATTTATGPASGVCGPGRLRFALAVGGTRGYDVLHPGVRSFEVSGVAYRVLDVGNTLQFRRAPCNLRRAVGEPS